jgi:hypothetical protein
MDLIEQMVSLLVEGNPPPAQSFRLLFHYQKGTDPQKLRSVLSSKLGYTEDIQALSKKITSIPGLPTGSTYVERWNPETEKFHLVGNLKDFRGYYPVL